MSKTAHTGEASEPRTTIQDGCASRGRRPCPAPARVREAGRGRADRGGEAALTVSGRRGVPTLTVLGGRGASGRRAGPCRCPAGRAGLWRPRRVPPWPCCHALRTISSARGRPASLCHLLVSGTCPCTQHKLPIDRTCVEIKARLCVVLILKTSPVQGKKKKTWFFSSPKFRSLVDSQSRQTGVGEGKSDRHFPTRGRALGDTVVPHGSARL